MKRYFFVVPSRCVAIVFLIYSTCSLEREENWNVIEKFLKLNLNFKLDKLNAIVSSDWIDNKGCLSTLPHKHDVGGMFAAKLIRI